MSGDIEKTPQTTLTSTAKTTVNDTTTSPITTSPTSTRPVGLTTRKQFVVIFILPNCYTSRKEKE